MELIVKDVIRHRCFANHFVLEVTGHWSTGEFGETDEAFSIKSPYRMDTFKLLYSALRKMQRKCENDTNTETPFSLQANDDYSEGEKNVLMGFLPTDKQNTFLTIDTIFVRYYDEEGLERAIEIQE